jgi:hypothetical protein
MAVVQLTNYDDFKLMVAANSGVYYWLDQQRPSWFVYAHVGDDWYWLFEESADSFGAFTTLHRQTH